MQLLTFVHNVWITREYPYIQWAPMSYYIGTGVIHIIHIDVRNSRHLSNRCSNYSYVDNILYHISIQEIMQYFVLFLLEKDLARNDANTETIAYGTRHRIAVQHACLGEIERVGEP